MVKNNWRKRFDRVLDRYFKYLVHYQYDINNDEKGAKKKV